MHLDFADIIVSHPQATNADKPNPVWSYMWSCFQPLSRSRGCD